MIAKLDNEMYVLLDSVANSLDFNPSLSGLERSIMIMSLLLD